MALHPSASSALRLFTALGALALVGCSGTSHDGKATDDTPAVTNAITYQKDIRPLVEQHCLGCHVDGGIAPFALDGFDAVEQHGSAMVAQVSSGAMPPWPADDSCHPLRDPASLPQATRDLFEAWKKDGFLEGDAKDYKAPKAPAVVDIGEPNVLMDPGEAYVTPRDISDNYRCFLMPQGFDTDTYIRAVDIRPGQRTTVHHVQIHTIPGSSAAQVEALDAQADGPGYPCAGASGGAGDYNLFSWRPGTTLATFEPGDAVLVEAGTRVVIQVHYNTVHLAEGEEAPPDLTQVAFWTLPEGELPDRIVRRASLISFSLNIPPGEANYSTKQTWPLSLLSRVGSTFVPGELVGQTPHMHQIGSRLAVKRTDVDGNETCMIDVPRWSFEWQMDYFYDPSAPVAFTDTDSLTVECDYDNSPAHQPVVNGQQLTPRQITWGEGSYDEMCLNYVWMRYDRDTYLGALAQ